jgi:hypothetical protein
VLVTSWLSGSQVGGTEILRAPIAFSPGMFLGTLRRLLKGSVLVSLDGEREPYRSGLRS